MEATTGMTVGSSAWERWCIEVKNEITEDQQVIIDKLKMKPENPEEVK